MWACMINLTRTGNDHQQVLTVLRLPPCRLHSADIDPETDLQSCEPSAGRDDRRSAEGSDRRSAAFHGARDDGRDLKRRMEVSGGVRHRTL